MSDSALAKSINNSVNGGALIHSSASEGSTDFSGDGSGIEIQLSEESIAVVDALREIRVPVAKAMSFSTALDDLERYLSKLEAHGGPRASPGHKSVPVTPSIERVVEAQADAELRVTALSTTRLPYIALIVTLPKVTALSTTRLDRDPDQGDCPIHRVVRRETTERRASQPVPVS